MIAAIVAALLLVFPECAWVLLVNGKAKVAEFTTLSRCMDEAKRNIMKVQSPDISRSPQSRRGQSWRRYSSEALREFRYDCVPDTVDPRGPKGK